MKIKITVNLPLEENIKPPIGSIHEVVHCDTVRGCKQKLYFISYKGIEIGVYPHECEVVNNET